MSEYEPSPYDFVADHVAAYERSSGTDGSEFNGFPCVVLTTRGRRSGKVRKSPLIRVADGDNYVVIASMGGQREHPLWYRNLVADPEVTLQDGATVTSFRARTASAEERDRLWALANDVYPEYEVYQTRCERQIPVVVLEVVVS